MSIFYTNTAEIKTVTLWTHNDHKIQLTIMKWIQMLYVGTYIDIIIVETYNLYLTV